MKASLGGRVTDAAIEVLWGTAEPPRRGPKPGFTAEAVARAGIAVADAGGLAAISMQRVADRLGVTKMALYRYVPGKTELIALMVDTAVGPPPSPSGDRPGWRAALTSWSRELFTRFAAHPWLVEATVGARVMGPHELAWLDRAISAFDGTGLSGAERMDAVVVLVGHVRTIAQQAAMGGDEGEITASMSRLLAGRAERFPALAAALDSTVNEGGRNDALEFGLARILDGLEVLIAARSG